MRIVQNKTCRSYEGQIIWIIGASSGIGKALCEELASRGATIILSSRRIQELDLLKKSLKGTRHEIFALDVCDDKAVFEVAHTVHQQFGRLDRVIFLAAAYKPMCLDAMDLLDVRHMIATNLLGAFYVLHALIPIFKKQSCGQIALCGSVAGYMGLVKGQPYSATKAALINLAESLRCELDHTIDVKIINPGFVQTPLTAKNNFHMPMMLSSNKAAQFIADGLLKRKFEIHFPKRFTLFLKFLRLLPYALSIYCTSKLKPKE